MDEGNVKVNSSAVPEEDVVRGSILMNVARVDEVGSEPAAATAELLIASTRSSRVLVV